MSDILMQAETRINEIIADIGEKTGKQHPTLNDGVQELKKGYGQGEEFIGIKYSDFTGERGKPKVADASSLPPNDYMKADTGGYAYLFYSANTNANGGWNNALETIFIPRGQDSIGNWFMNCHKLKNIYGDFSEIKIIANNAFNNCRSLTEIPYMPKLHSLLANAFYGCSGLTSFKFYTKASSIHTYAFTGCINLTDIYVPWAEGEVSGAPWGATNATIHYNTTYDENGNPIIAEV